MHDVIVIGAGPIGSYTAYLLADQGFEVALLEEDEAVGRDVLCTGVIGKEAFSRFDLPRDSIIIAVRSFSFVSPSGQRLQYFHPDDLAYVVDRKRFDEGIFEMAKKRGVDVRLGVKITSVKGEGEDLRIQGVKGLSDKFRKMDGRMSGRGLRGMGVEEEYRAKAVAVATGVDYRLQRSLRMGSPPGFLLGAQTEVEMDGTDSSIEIHTGQEVAPGSFGWVVPLGEGRSRVGVLTRFRARFYLERLIQRLASLHPKLNHQIGGINLANIREKPIAYGPVARSVADRVLAVGEAAGQVKTTTGGGIFYGLICSELAVDTLSKALRKGDLSSKGLSKYEERWRNRLALELEAGFWIRQLAERMDDKQLDRCFSLVKQNPSLVRLIKKRIKFDYHSELLSFCLRAFKQVMK